MTLEFLEECIKNTYHDITTSVLKKDMNKIHVQPHTFNFFSTWSDKQEVDVLVIKPNKYNRAHDLESIFITQYHSDKSKFMITLNFCDRPNCGLIDHKNFTWFFEFAEVLKLVHDALIPTPNNIIDFNSRIRLEAFLPYLDVDTWDRFRELERRKFDFKNSGLNILFYSHVRFDVYNCANVEHHVLKSNKFFRIGITNKREDYKTLSDEYVSYIDESDVFNVIHILEQLYADTQQYELSSDKYNRDLISFGAKLWPMISNGSVNADVHFGKTLSVYGTDKPRKLKAVNNLPNTFDPTNNRSCFNLIDILEQRYIQQ